MIFGDIPGIDDAVEAKLDYWPDKFSPNFDTPMWTIWWLSNGGSLCKMYYKYYVAQDSKTPIEQLSWWNGNDATEVLVWNFGLGWWTQTIEYALNVLYLQMPWALLLWSSLG